MQWKLAIDRSQWLNDLPAKLLSVAAAVLLFFFNRIDSVKPRYITSTIRLIIPSELIPAEAYNKRVRVLLRGPQEMVEGVLEDDIEVLADFSVFTREGIYSVPLQVIRRGSALEAENIEISLENMEITLNLQRKQSKVLSVNVPFTGDLVQGLELDSVLTSPSAVTVEGARTLVESLRTAETETLDLTGRLESFTARVRLLNPDPLVEFRGGSVIEVKVNIKPLIIEKELEGIPITARNLLPTLEPSKELPLLKIRMSGPQIQLDLTEASTLSPYLSFENITEPGTYTLPVKWNLDQRIQVLEQSPELVTVILVAK